MTTDEDWEIAQRVCTAKELEVLALREQLHDAKQDYGYRSIATKLDLSWSTVRDRIERAEARIQRERGARR